MAFPSGFCSLSVMYSRFVYVVACIGTSTLLMDERYSVVGMCGIPIHQLMDLWLVIQVLVIANNVAVNISLQMCI